MPFLVGMSVLAGAAEPSVRLMTLDPGHFHAALIQKEMYEGVSPTVNVYAPLGPDLLGHLGRIAAYNERAEKPTSWRLEVHTGPDFLERMLRDKPGNVVVISGKNRGKIDRILASVEAGLHVLADKPWLIDEADLPKLRKALDTAEAKGLVAYDVMTERYEITTLLQGELLRDPEIAGPPGPGTPEEPTFFIDSVHNLMKTVSGAPLVRPSWFFDTDEQGEALADVGTHLVDLAAFVLFPGQAMTEREARILAAKRWPTTLSREQLLRVTGSTSVAPALLAKMKDDRLDYYCNTRVDYTLRGLHVRLLARWDYEAPPGGGDTHFAVGRGSRARIEVRQGAEQKWRTELYVVPASPGDRPALLAAVRKKVESLASRYPGLKVAEAGEAVQVLVPDSLRTGHEAHFAEVTTRFLDYLKAPGRSRPGRRPTCSRSTPSPPAAPPSAERKPAPDGDPRDVSGQAIGIDLRTRSGPGVLFELTGVIARHQGDITSVEILAGAEDESRVYFEIRLPGEAEALLQDLRRSPAVRGLSPVATMTRIYGKRIIIVGGGAQVGQVAIGAISEADRHNIRGEHISVDTIPLVGEQPLAEAVRAVTRLPRARASSWPAPSWAATSRPRCARCARRASWSSASTWRAACPTRPTSW